MIPVGSVVEVKRHPGWGEACVKSHWKTGGVVLNFIVFACDFGWFYEDHELVKLVEGSGCDAGDDSDSKARERRLLFLRT
jgi:hypothetical protein